MITKVTTEEMWELYQAGATLREVGARYGITHQAVSLRFRNAGHKLRPRYETAILHQQRALIADRDALIEALRLWNTTLESSQTIAQRVGLPQRRVRDYINANTTKESRLDRFKEVMRYPESKVYTDEDLLDGIRACAAHLGRVPGIKAYDKFAKSNNLAHSGTVCGRFTAWSIALVEAGFTPYARPKKMGLPTYTHEDFEEAIQRVAKIVGHRPSQYEYSDHRLPQEPTSEAFSKRFGSWLNALDILL